MSFQFYHDYESEDVDITFDEYAPYVAFCLSDRAVIYNLAHGAWIGERQHRGYRFRRLYMRREMPYAVAWGAARKKPQILEASTLRHVTYLHGHREDISEMKLSPDGQYLATLSLEEQILRVWSMDTLECIQMFGVSQAASQLFQGSPLLQFSPDSRYIAYHDDYETPVTLGEIGYGPCVLSYPPEFAQGTAHYDARFSPCGENIIIKRTPSKAEAPEVWLCHIENGAYSRSEKSWEEWLEWPFTLTHQINKGPESTHWRLGFQGQHVELPKSIKLAALSPDQKYLVLMKQHNVSIQTPQHTWQEFSNQSFEMLGYHGVAKLLRETQLPIKNALEVLQGEDLLLRWFAIECSLHLLRGKKLTPVMRRLLRFCKKYTLNEQLTPAERVEGYHLLKDTNESCFWPIKANRAINAARISTNGIDEDWSRHRIAYLCEVWAVCGARSAWLLLEGQCPLPEPPKAPLRIPHF